MLHALWKLLLDGMSKAPIPILPAYGKQPVHQPKTAPIYGILSLEQVQVQKPVVLPNCCRYPLSAEIHLTLAAPPHYSGIRCFTELQEKLLPSMLALPCVFTGYTTTQPTADMKLQKMTLTAKFTLQGIWETDTGGAAVE